MACVILDSILYHSYSCEEIPCVCLSEELVYILHLAVALWLPTITSEASFESDQTGTTRSSSPKEGQQLKTSSSGWKCSMCDLAFPFSPVLVDHVRKVHCEMKAGESRICPFCKKQFPTYTQLGEFIV